MPETTVITGLDAVTRVERLLPDWTPGAAAADSSTTNPRTALAAAAGRAAAGLRTSVRLTGADLEAGLDLLAAAVARRLPLVIQVALGDHRPWHAASATGAVQLLARDGQHAADLTLVARRVAEEALTPVLLGLDAATAAGVGDLHLPAAALVRSFAGRPQDTVHGSRGEQAGTAHEMLLGRHRRRLVPWHDLARPLAAGMPLPPAAALAAAAARRAYLDPRVGESLDAALAELGMTTGRPLAHLEAWRTDGARVVLLTQGAAMETVRAAVGATAGGVLGELLGGRRVGVVALTTLRPLPAGALAEALRGADLAVVLERVDGGLDGDGPLTRETAAALHLLGERHRPRLATVVHGVGGASLRAADLAALLEVVHRKAPRGRQIAVPRYLGTDLAPADEPWPKRRVVLDALRRGHPEAGGLALRGRGETLDLRPGGAYTVALPAGELSADLAALLHRLAGGHLRACDGLLTWTPDDATPAIPVADTPVEVTVWTSATAPPEAADLRPLVAGGAVVLTGDPSGWRQPFSAAAVRLAADRDLGWYTVSASGGGDDPHILLRECQLGASLGVLAAAGHLSVQPRKLQEARRAHLLEQGLDGATADTRVAALQAAFDRVHEARLDDLADASPAARDAAAAPAEVPAAVRDAGTPPPGAATVGSLAHLWDQVVGPRRLGDGNGLGNGDGAPLPSPHLATGMLPARSAALLTTAHDRAMLPAFHPELCTGCGACWTACPDGAVAPVAVGARALLEHGMARVAAAGGSAEPLRMAVRKLAGALEQELETELETELEKGLEKGGHRSTVERLDVAYDRSVAKMPLPDERKETIRTAYEAVRDVLAPLPLAATEVFGATPFALALDPDACKGCRLCVAECEPGALTAEPDTPQRSRDARRLWNLAATLPAPAEETVRTAEEEAGPLAAAMLPADHRAVLTGADGAEPGDGPSLAARQVLAVAHARLAPRQAELHARLDARGDELAEAIQGSLSRALPGRDLDALSRGLDALDRSEAELTDLIGRVEAAFDSDRVDVPRLRHLVDAARELAGLREVAWAPFSVVVGPGGPADRWPANPWSVPMTAVPASAGDAAALARGVLEGQLAAALRPLRALRRAGRELEAVREKRSGGPATEKRLEAELETLRTLGWHDLEDDERHLCPPLFLLAGETELLHGGLPGLLELLRGDLPVKVLLLSDGGGEELPFAPPVHALCTVAHGDQLTDAVTAALEHHGPALLRVLAPVPRRHDLATDDTVARCRAAVEAGEWALSLHRPGDSGEEPAEPATVPSEELEALQRQHEQELARLRADYEQRLTAQQHEIRTHLAQQVRGKLLALALRKEAS